MLPRLRGGPPALARAGPWGPLALALAASACGPSTSLEVRWVHWLEHREVIDMAVSPDGETVVVGRDDDDMPAAPSPEEPPPWRPWLARLAEDGTRLHDWVEGRGQAHGVAMDADGRAYVLLSELYDDPDPATPERCELRALDDDGQVRWSRSWSEPSCPVDVATAAEAVVVTVHDGPSSQHLEAFELDGRPRWQQPAPATYSLAALGDEIWLATTIAEVATLHAVAWRIDARDGQAQQVPLDLGGSRFLGPYVATEHGLFVLTISAASYGPAKHLVSLTLDGRRRWDREVVPAWDDAAAASWQLDASRAGFDGRDPWVLGFETRTDSLDAEDPQWDYRVALQRWSADGTHQDTLRPSPEQLGDPADVPHSACLPSDVARGSRVGSGVARPDGPLIVAGRRGCRDSFVLGMTVER